MLSPIFLTLHYDRRSESHSVRRQTSSYHCDRAIEVDSLPSGPSEIDTDGGVAFDERDDPESSRGEVGSHEDVDLW